MTRTTAIFSLLIGVTAFADEVKWGTDYTKALEQAKKEGKPLLIYFWSAGEEWCKRLAAETHSKKEIAEAANQNFVCVKVDSDADKERTQKFGIVSVPMQIVVNGDEEIVACLWDYVYGKSMAKVLAKISDGWQAINDALKKTKDKPNDDSALFAYANTTLDLGNLDKARELFSKVRKDIESKKKPSEEDMKMLAQALASLGRLSFKAIDKDAMLSVVESMRKLDTKFELADNAEILEEISKVLDIEPNEENMRKTREALEKLAGKYPKSDQGDAVLLILASVCIQMKDEDKATQYAEQIVKDFPDSFYVDVAQMMVETKKKRDK